MGGRYRSTHAEGDGKAKIRWNDRLWKWEKNGRERKIKSF